MDETRHLASWIGGQEALHDRVLTLEEALAEVAAVTAADIRRVAGELFTDEGLRLAVVAPATVLARPREATADAGVRAFVTVVDTLAIDADERAADLVLARIHLRLGSLGLARAELEGLAGRNGLDDEGIRDLAEARWRTGDLPGAGEAAAAYLETHPDDVLCLVISAELQATLGRPAEARRLAGRALTKSNEPVDQIFAGMPRSPIWPIDPGRAGRAGRHAVHGPARAGVAGDRAARRALPGVRRCEPRAGSRAAGSGPLGRARRNARRHPAQRRGAARPVARRRRGRPAGAGRGRAGARAAGRPDAGASGPRAAGRAPGAGPRARPWRRPSDRRPRGRGDARLRRGGRRDRPGAELGSIRRIGAAGLRPTAAHGIRRARPCRSPDSTDVGGGEGGEAHRPAANVRPPSQPSHGTCQ